MIVLAHEVLRDVLSEVFSGLRRDPAPILDVFANLDERDRMEARRYFQETEIPIKLGYPRNPSELPGLYLVPGAMRETDQFLGQAFPDEENARIVAERRGSFFESNVAVSCWSQNADVVVWTSMVVLWALIGKRAQLSQLGLANPTLTVNGLALSQRFLPDFVFVRDVTMSAKSEVSADVDFFRLQSAVTTVTSGESSPVVTVSMG